ncbi:cathepsin L1-like isoform X1 [Varroa jacobsoni]|uniref:cathepsin L1-like isoform X1 n=1 Tax=Varroa jacobsoni TaxID=62625 RepID=UPI000BF3BDBA|nr:cathepsin L1-like isoform X1 [Varroa jacobsoni]XP_022703928.1 cathepsin L1-like isoform X1 [Varroa jacobsoni]XP_022703929.1 cathepsin L1-like isoform X1 [Varroa jacobsoni]XP_022703930.1 cathepsin L1-like isoform X1 [Varroa jacobsoni]
MKVYLLVLCVAALAIAIRQPDPRLDKPWEDFKVKYNRSYANVHDELMRRMIFEQSYRFIAMHNADPKHFNFTLGMNQFGDLTNKEYKRIYLGYRVPEGAQSKADYTFIKSGGGGKEAPDKIDWRDKGYVTDVKDQGQCGSCWAFSAVGSLEGQHFRSTGKLVSLSEQNLVDCSTPEGNNGCNGGWMDKAFQYVKENKGIDTEAAYPYISRQGVCRYDAKSIGATIKAYFDVQPGDEEALRQVVGTKGPVSVAIDASSKLFQFYRGGVYNVPWCSSTELDHGVLVVGYGRQFQSKDFWLVKNSWGKDWGIYGYIMMSRNKNNQCGIATMASMPIV